MYRVLVTPLEQVGKFSDVFSILKKEDCEVVKSPYPHPVEEKNLLKIIQEIDAVITGSDVEAPTKKGIVVTYAPNQNGVADLTVGLMLCLARRICEANASVKTGGWKRVTGVNVWQRTLGVIGAGRIGQAVIKRARGFEMKILVYDIYRDEKLAEELDFEYTSLERLLKESDFAAIHVPLNNKTKGLIGEKEIELMKSSAYLINTARGGIVDEKALYLALKEKRLAGAALDAHMKEPPSKENPLLKLDNVIVTPHMGADSQETLKNMDLVAAENVLRVLRGESPLYALNFPFT